MAKMKDEKNSLIKPVKLSKVEIEKLSATLKDLNIPKPANIENFAAAVKHINPKALVPVEKLPEDVKSTLSALKHQARGFHGAKIALNWFPLPMIFSPCADKFGYLTSNTVRQSSKLDMNPVTVNLLNTLGGMMGNPGRDTGGDSNIPAGYTYFGQFVDHDITLDVSSDINNPNLATAINNMRTPSLDLDNVYGRGPALSPYLYEFPTTGPVTAIKMKLGRNIDTGKGGPSTSGGGAGAMAIKADADVPRMDGTNTAVIGDPRNDENLIVSQFQMAMLKFHNKVVDILISAGFTGDIFVEAKKIVTHHYQWAVIHDFLKRICGNAVVTNSLSSVAAPINSAFSMPVEFSVAAYRFGHSLIRNQYWVNHTFINVSLIDSLKFLNNPNLPPAIPKPILQSNLVVDFNAFFQTGIPVPVFNFARQIDSFLANGLEHLPDQGGFMAILASRNLRRGLAFGLPSGQATATALGVAPMTSAQLLTGLPPDEVALLNSSGGLLLQKTPLWYYILREAKVLGGGNSLGPLGAKIVADTFVRILKRDPESYINKTGGFIPFLSPDGPGNFTVTDIIKVSEVNLP